MYAVQNEIECEIERERDGEQITKKTQNRMNVNKIIK